MPVSRSHGLTTWLPHSLRRQFLFAVSALTLLILAGGITAVYALRSSAATIRLLAEERLVQMQQAQDLLQQTLLIERASFQLVDARSLAEMRNSYADIVKLLGEFDDLVNRLAASDGARAVLDLHHTGQLFRNTVNVAAQLRENELQAVDDPGRLSRNTAQSSTHYLHALQDQAEALLNAAHMQSQRFTQHYREAMRQLDEMTRRNMHWVTVLLAGSLLLAWLVARWFLGRHVLGRLLLVSRSLRLGETDARGRERQTLRASPTEARDEIDEMARAAALFQEDRLNLKQRTEQLRLARDAAEAANRAKSVFLANMSHELRTPLNAILGFSNLMREEEGLSREHYQSLDIINHSGAHLLKLINDVLEIAKIEAGKLQLASAAFDLHELVREVIDMMRLRAQQRGLRLELDQSSGVPRYIKGDEARLRQILVNLVGNAVKFTDEGGVTVRLGIKNNTRQHLLIEIEDTGVGVTEEDRQRLFEPFVQATETMSRGGTGLGLSIVQQFAQLMGGSVVVESTPGKGSRFSVELPFEQADARQISQLIKTDQSDVAGLAPGQPDYRILIAEDHRDNQLLLAKLMRDIGLQSKIAGNGEECVQLFKQWRPHLIWMDRRMPVMDGVTATRQIRRLDGGHKVKIVAVTASVFKEQEPELLAIGLDGFVRKPYRPSEIYDCLAKQLGVEYIYRKKAAETKATQAPLQLGRLAQIGADLRYDLKRAVESLDSEKIFTVIRKIAADDPELGDSLSHRAEEFDYPRILEALKAVADE
jgi:signal transduction histidine kinase/CheY-like chemotaxis protein